MLRLTRRIGESLIIGDEIKITVIEVTGDDGACRGAFGGRVVSSFSYY